jgi:hypothetical protein
MRRFLVALMLLASPALAQDQGLDAWKTIQDVVTHPRCANCHTADDRPRWFNAGEARASVHAMNVRRGVDGLGNPGLRCTTCHQTSNATKNGPPGAVNWHLAPASMAWFEQKPAAICARLKDLSQNGNRDIAALAEHVLKDQLVAWGWAPGGTREPAPHSAEVLHDAIIAWGAAGSPCPAN